MKINKTFLFTIITLLVIAIGAGVAAFLAKGYTFSPDQGRLVTTGIISATSTPDGAAVYVDGHLTTATNATISSLPPKKYNVKLVKEGFITWEKDVEVREGLVTEVKATLFPAIPTVYPLTYNGIVEPILSPDGQKLAFGVPMTNELHTKQKGGIWVWTMGNQPIAFNRGAEPHQVVVSTQNLDFSKASIKWSPDSKQLLVTMQQADQTGENNVRNFLISADDATPEGSLRDITPTLQATLDAWTEDERVKDQARILSLEDMNLRKIASDSAFMSWSPDETKFMVAAKADAPVVKNTKPVAASPSAQLNEVKYKDFRVFALTEGDRKLPVAQPKEYKLPEAKAYYWLPDSEHIILVQEGKIAVCEYDGSNVSIVYAGNFENGFVFPWPDSSRLTFVSSYQTPTASTPNLFGINLK